MHLIHAKEKICGNIFSIELGLVWIITFKLCVKFGWHLSSKFTYVVRVTTTKAIYNRRSVLQKSPL